jgi:TetR/AcrR family transcriptional repressor of nem operon
MRYPKAYKFQTRQRIVQAASRGFDGIAIGELMAELELTHGEFYRHFPTKESLYAETLAYSIDDGQATLLSACAEADKLTLRDVIRAYLSPDHCANVAGGCPVAALAADIARQSPTIQTVFEQALQRYRGRFLPLMKGATQAERERQFLVLSSGMAGTLSVARAVSDDALRRSMLEATGDFCLRTFCE